MKTIRLKIIPHVEQRYDTCGDYWETKKSIEFRVSGLDDWRFEFLVFAHELIEWAWGKRKGLPIAEVDAFDKRYERDRRRGKYTVEQEPGHDPDSPYAFGHNLAEGVERILAVILHVKWGEYNAKINNL